MNASMLMVSPAVSLLDRRWTHTGRSCGRPTTYLMDRGLFRGSFTGEVANVEAWNHRIRRVKAKGVCIWLCTPAICVL